MSAVIIADGVLQDALEQQRQFLIRFFSIFVGEFKHGVLHNIQRRVLIPYREQRLFVSAAFGFGEEAGKFVVAGQFVSISMM